MTWTVVWRSIAETRLANIWLRSNDRQSITDAADEIDRLLRIQALEVGESREGTSRILTVDRLTVSYNVYDDDRLVEVWLVWRT